MVDIGKYTIHGCYGFVCFFFVLFGAYFFVERFANMSFNLVGEPCNMIHHDSLIVFESNYSLGFIEGVPILIALRCLCIYPAVELWPFKGMSRRCWSMDSRVDGWICRGSFCRFAVQFMFDQWSGRRCWHDQRKTW